ncbi:hypothetical protein HK096_005451 [Nowakowskiella sp. JEL0078]|nr:hypothetical protein HK096_005451 [Nowakowskiella sp. JEL0078]
MNVTLKRSFLLLAATSKPSYRYFSAHLAPKPADPSKSTVANTELRARLKIDLAAALRASKKREVSVIKSLLADFITAEKSTQGAPEALSDLVRRAVKRRDEAIAQYIVAEREDMAEIERNEIEILKRYIPALMGVEEIEKLVVSCVGNVGAVSAKDFGKVVKAVKETVENPAVLDMKMVTEVAKKLHD